MDTNRRDAFEAQLLGGDVGKRSRSRDSLFLVAGLRVDGDPMEEVRVRNLSEGGLMVELRRVVAVGTPVLLDIRGIGEVTGRIAWCTQGRVGIALDEMIDPQKARKPIGKGAKSPDYAKSWVHANGPPARR